MYDVVVVGGGPAGLSAAPVLGRCRRRVLLYDEGEPRNKASHAVHCLLGDEGTDLSELLAKGRAQLGRVLINRQPNADLDAPPNVRD
jgi:thioredoxin reductase